jgi:hypothetical protein
MARKRNFARVRGVFCCCSPHSVDSHTLRARERSLYLAYPNPISWRLHDHVSLLSIPSDAELPDGPRGRGQPAV